MLNTLSNNVRCLAPHELRNPISVLQDFSTRRDLEEQRRLLWEVLSAALSGAHVDSYSGAEVAQWVIYFQELEELLEASLLLSTNYYKDGRLD